MSGLLAHRRFANCFDNSPGSARIYPPRYELLDGVRGLAALAVVLTHHNVVSIGHEAVLVFFIISGYCITGAADAALRGASGGVVGFRQFMWRRIRRIYPPYLLALVFFIATRIVRAQMGRGAGLPADPVTWLQNATLTQWTALIMHPALAASDNRSLFVAAFWSLNYEEQFYLVVAVALLACGARNRLPHALALITAMSSIWLLLFGDESFRGVFFEYWPHFAIGASLFLVLCHAPNRLSVTLYTGALAILVVLSAAVRVFYSERLATDLILLGVVALLLLAARPLSAHICRHRFWQPIAFLGTISYSLYLIHQFNLTLTNSIGRAVAGPTGPGWLVAGVAVAMQIVIATVFWYCCERPFLNRPRRENAPHTQDRRSPAVSPVSAR